MTKQPQPSDERAGTKNPLQGGVKDKMRPPSLPCGAPGGPGGPLARTLRAHLNCLKRSGSASKRFLRLSSAWFRRCHSCSFWNCRFRVSAAMAGPERFTELDVRGRGRKKQRQRAASPVSVRAAVFMAQASGPAPPGHASGRLGPAPPVSSAPATRPCLRLQIWGPLLATL